MSNTDRWIIPFMIDLENGAPQRRRPPQGIMLPGDNRAHTIQVTAYAGREPAALSGTPRGYFIREADGATVICTGSRSGNVASVTMAQACYAYPGPLRCVIRLENSGNPDVTLVDTTFYVEPGTGENIIDPGTPIHNVTELLEHLEDMEEATANARGAVSYIAQAYSTSAIYTEGEYAIHDGRLYRCTTAITSAETWTPAHWTQVNFGAELYAMDTSMHHHDLLFPRNGGRITLTPAASGTMSVTVPRYLVRVRDRAAVNIDLGAAGNAYTVPDGSALILTGDNTLAVGTLNANLLDNNGNCILLYNDRGVPYGQWGGADKAEISALKSTLEDVTGVTFMAFQPGVRNCGEVGSRIGDVTLDTGAYVHGLAPCTSDDVVTVNVRGAGNARAWAYLDENYVVLQCSAENLWQRDVELPKPPEQTAYVLLNNRTGGGYMPTGYYGCVGKTIAPARAASLTRTDNIDMQVVRENFYYYPLNADLFEPGTVYIKNSAPTYDVGNGDVLRIKRGRTFSLRAGTDISVAAGYQVRILKVLNNVATSIREFADTGNTHIAETADYAMVLKTEDGSVIAQDDITVRKIFIKEYSQNQALIDELLEETDDLQTQAAELAATAESNSADIQTLRDNLYYYPLKTDMFEAGTAWVADGAIRYSAGNGDAMRIKSGKRLSLPSGAKISVANGYRARVIKIADGTASTVANFTTADVVLPDTADYSIVFGTTDGSPISVDTAALRGLYIKGVSQNQEIIDRLFPNFNYAYSGKKISLEKHGYNVVDNGGFAESGSKILSGTQGCAIYGDILFMARNNARKIVLFDMTSHELIAELSADVGHANSCQFSSERYDPDDEFPLLYISEFNNNLVYVYRVSRSEATLIKTIGLSGEPGYKVNIAVDAASNRLFTLGTHLDDAFERTDNHMILSVYDLSRQDASGGLYYPQFISKTTLPFIFCVQDCKYINGHLMVLSSAAKSLATQYGENPTWIYWIDPYHGETETIFKQFPTAMSEGECEMADVYIKDGKTYLFTGMYYAETSYLIELDG